MQSCSRPSPMAAGLRPANPSSLASRSSVFLANGGTALSSWRLRLVPKRTSGAGSPPRGLKLRCLFGLGVPELAVIAGVATLVFGPKQLPEIGRTMGKTVKSFQQAAKEFETELKKGAEDANNHTSPAYTQNFTDEDEKKELEATGAQESA